MIKLFLFILLIALIPSFAYGDSKMTDLTADVTPTADDLVWTTNSPASSPSDRKVTLSDIWVLYLATGGTPSGTWDWSSATVTWPTFNQNTTGNASTATALAANPDACAAGSYVSDIAANGTLTCANPLDTPTFILADDSTITLPTAASAYDPGLLGCGTDGTCSWVDPSTLLTSVDLSTVTIGGGTASRMAEWDGSGNLTSSDTATTGTGAPVKGTDPQISQIQLGHASDTTIARAAAGDVSVEGVKIFDRNRIVTASKAAAYTIGTDDANEAYGGVIYVTSAAVITAPAVVSGMSFTVITIGAIAVSLDVNANDRMYLDGVLLDDGDKATNTSTTGDTITCTYYSADGWYCMSGSPDGDKWTDGGA